MASSISTAGSLASPSGVLAESLCMPSPELSAAPPSAKSGSWLAAVGSPPPSSMGSGCSSSGCACGSGSAGASDVVRGSAALVGAERFSDSSSRARLGAGDVVASFVLGTASASFSASWTAAADSAVS
eukprot:scaffold7381_cov310-Pinguiococcus_pyrenoidosus.AAC.106